MVFAMSTANADANAYNDDANNNGNDEGNEEEEEISAQIAVTSRAMAFAALWTAVLASLMSIFGTVILGFQSPTGQYYTCCSGNVHRTTPLGMGAFVGALLMFANMTLVCSVLFGEFEVSSAFNMWSVLVVSTPGVISIQFCLSVNLFVVLFSGFRFLPITTSSLPHSLTRSLTRSTLSRKTRPSICGIPFILPGLFRIRRYDDLLDRRLSCCVLSNGSLVIQIRDFQREGEDRGGRDGEAAASMAVERSSMAFSIMCMFLTILYAGFAALVFAFSNSVLEENQADIADDNLHRQQPHGYSGYIDNRFDVRPSGKNGFVGPQGSSDSRLA